MLQPNRLFQFRNTVAALLLAAVFNVVAVVPTQAQSYERTRPNAIYLELGGSGVFYSLNAERLLANTYALRAGVSYTDLLGSRLVTLPATVSVLIEGPTPETYVEIGAGPAMLWGRGPHDRETGRTLYTSVGAVVNVQLITGLGFGLDLYGNVNSVVSVAGARLVFQVGPNDGRP